MHQHWYDLTPLVWFVHFRGVATRSCSPGASGRWSTRPPPGCPASPGPPHTQLPADRLADLLGGGAPSIGGTVSSPSRCTGLTACGSAASTSPRGLNVSSSVQFQPLADGRALVVPDFSMTAAEVQPVLAAMRSAGWDVGCLDNQETDEDPPLFFSHLAKAGEPLALAREIRAGLDRTATASRGE